MWQEWGAYRSLSDHLAIGLNYQGPGRVNLYISLCLEKMYRGFPVPALQKIPSQPKIIQTGSGPNQGNIEPAIIRMNVW